MRLFPREDYLKKIRGFYDADDIIKVITGVRRCGKSCLMQTVASELTSRGVPPENIVYIDLDSKPNRKIRTVDQLEAVIDGSGAVSGLKYLFIDEVQNVRGFEELINAYRNDGGWSIFLTGSNSYLLSGELATKLTGRYIEFEMQTLSFREYCDMKRFLGKDVSPNLTAEFDTYILEGGFPRAVFLDTPQDKRAYVKSVIDEIYNKDIHRRVQVRNRSVFEQVRTYLINNFGATTSITNILGDLEKQGVRLKRETLYRYIRILENAKIVRRCTRFDMKSRKSLQGEEKFYLSDLSFYFATNTDNRINYGPVLENIVYNYALSRGYEVSVGRIGKLECDFILRSPNMDYAYIQVAMTIMGSKETEDREYAPFELIRDGYPRYLMTRGDPIQRRSGVRHVNIPDFIAAGEDWL